MGAPGNDFDPFSTEIPASFAWLNVINTGVWYWNFSQRKRSKKALPPAYLRPVRFCGKKLRVFAAMVIQGFCQLSSTCWIFSIIYV